MEKYMRMLKLDAYKGLRWLWLSVVVLCADQASKILVLRYLDVYETKEWLSFLSMTLVHNHGVAFGGFGHLQGWKVWILLLVVLCVVAYLIFWLAKTTAQERMQAVSLSLIIGGAMGNLLDRIMYGYVVDFIDFHVAGWHWYVFNVADSAICIGVLLLMWQLWQADSTHHVATPSE
jgi:signal peptidase II